ncbi:MAG: O-antigen ligase family protein [Solirubrobacteraceae bacterium]
MLAFAALNGPLPKLGVVAVALLAAAVLVAPDRRRQALAMLGALLLSPVLLMAEIWHSHQIATLHRHPALAVVAGIVALAALIGVAAALRRRAWLVPVLAVIALPFRVPIQAGGKTANLLVPLYLVVAAGSLAWIWSAVRAPEAVSPAPAAADGRMSGLVRTVERLLALYLVLYGLQAVYSADFELALQNMVFFYVPFALLYRVMRTVSWDRRLLRACLLATVALAIASSVLGFYEYATKTIILGSKVAVTDELHTYFTVNSVFLDPNIFGRYLALTMILLAVWLIYDRGRAEQTRSVVVLAILWVCLVLTLSRSSMGALVVGMVILAALRWKPGRTLMIAAAVIAIGAAVVAATPGTFGLTHGVNNASSGRSGLISGGLRLFADRPIWGWGSGSFSTEYRRHNPHLLTTLSDSHTIPVTVAAEQGLIGELAYVAFVIAAIVLLVRGARGDPVRSAVAAAFIALVFHTFLYADFLEDPTTWVLLGIGAALARAPVAVSAATESEALRRSAAATLASAAGS